MFVSDPNSISVVEIQEEDDEVVIDPYNNSYRRQMLTEKFYQHKPNPMKSLQTKPSVRAEINNIPEIDDDIIVEEMNTKSAVKFKEFDSPTPFEKITINKNI